MSTLYILHRSPYSAAEMETALRLAKSGDGIIFTQDAVFALRSTPEEISIGEFSRRNLRFYALKTDMQARAVEAIAGVKTIDYVGLIDLLREYDRTFS